jgi:hypothetical protein
MMRFLADLGAGMAGKERKKITSGTADDGDGAVGDKMEGVIESGERVESTTTAGAVKEEDTTKGKSSGTGGSSGKKKKKGKGR